MFQSIKKDIKAVGVNPIMVFMSNRGFHALFVYRVAHFLWRKKFLLSL